MQNILLRSMIIVGSFAAVIIGGGAAALMLFETSGSVWAAVVCGFALLCGQLAAACNLRDHLYRECAVSGLEFWIFSGGSSAVCGLVSLAGMFLIRGGSEDIIYMFFLLFLTIYSAAYAVFSGVVFLISRHFRALSKNE